MNQGQGNWSNVPGVVGVSCIVTFNPHVTSRNLHKYKLVLHMEECYWLVSHLECVSWSMPARPHAYLPVNTTDITTYLLPCETGMEWCRSSVWLLLPSNTSAWQN